MNDCVFMTAQQLLEYLKSLQQNNNSSTTNVKQRKNKNFASVINNVNSVIWQNVLDFERGLDASACAVPKKSS